MPATPRLLIRAEGGPGVGSGHLGRCLALAQAWRDTGGEVALVANNVPPPWDRRYRDDGVEILPAQDGWQSEGADWVVLDGYGFGPDVQHSVRAAGHRLLVVDDHGTIGQYDCDVIVDQNLGAKAGAYAARQPATELLLGLSYVLVRREFRAQRGADLLDPVVARHLLVSLGGSPPSEAVALVDAALASTQFEVRRITSEPDVAAVMRQSDLAVAAAGVTAWELCAMAVPSVLLVLAPNQLPVAQALDAAGAAVSLGDYRDVTPAALARAVEDLANDRTRRTRAAEVGRGLVDGRGARRIVSVLGSFLVDLRLVTEADAQLLWEWANEPVVRQMAFSTDPIAWGDHERWLKERLSDSATWLYIGSHPGSGEPFGQVRFDVTGSEAEIDVSVARQQRHRGSGAALVRAASRRAFSDAEVTSLLARIRPENLASAAAFSDAGYRLEGERSDGQKTWLQYSLHRDDRAG